MSADLMVKQLCDHCGSTAELYGSTCKHLKLCLDCGKSMAQKDSKCFECGIPITRLLRPDNGEQLTLKKVSGRRRIARQMMKAPNMGGDSDESDESEDDFEECPTRLHFGVDDMENCYDWSYLECTSDDDLATNTVFMELDENGWHEVDEERAPEEPDYTLKEQLVGAYEIPESSDDEEYEYLSESGRETLQLLQKFHWLNDLDAVDDDGNGNDDENEYETTDDDGALRRSGELDDANNSNMEDDIFAVFSILKNDRKGEPVDRSTTTPTAFHEATSSLKSLKIEGYYEDSISPSCPSLKKVKTKKEVITGKDKPALFTEHRGATKGAGPPVDKSTTTSTAVHTATSSLKSLKIEGYYEDSNSPSCPSLKKVKTKK